MLVNRKKNPLFGAISNGHIEVAKILIDNGINIDVTYNGSSKKNVDAITFAREQGEEEIAKLLENHKKTSITMEEENNSNQEHHDVILKHVTNSFGSIKNSISEHIPGSRVAINIHIIPPSNNKNFITLVTTGMSDRPMDYSKEDSVYKYAELLLKLPLNWEIEKESMNDEKKSWPIAWFRKVAHIPHIYDGWIEEGVILPNGEPPQPFAENTKLSCMMVCRPKESELSNTNIKQRNIRMYTLIPIYEEERNLALEKGYDYLLKKNESERDFRCTELTSNECRYIGI